MGTPPQPGGAARSPRPKCSFAIRSKRSGVGTTSNYPVSAKKIDSLREILADGVEGSYEIDAVFFTLALAVYNLETSGIEFRRTCSTLKRAS